MSNFYCAKIIKEIIYENFLRLTPSLGAVILDKIKTINEKINKKYYEIMRQADNAVGRKEVVSLLKKAAIIKSKSEENLAV